MPQVDRSMNRDHTLLQCVLKQMLQNFLGKFLVSSQLNHLANSASHHIIDVPADGFLILVANQNFAQFAMGASTLQKAK